MTYPSINGATINGSDGGLTLGLQPVQFGTPSLLMTMHASGLQPARFGLASVVMRVASLRPVRFGPASLIMQADSLQPVRFGTPTLEFRMASLRPVQFGPAHVKFGTDIVAESASLTPVHFGDHRILGGQPPAAWVRLADSLQPVRFGTPSLATSLHVGPVSGLEPVRFGPPALHCAMPAASLLAGVFGTHQLAVGVRSESLRPARFGVGHAVHRLGAAPLRSVQFGPASARLGGIGLSAASLQPVQFGVPSLGGMALRARSMCPVRFGRPTLDRVGIC